MTGDGLWLPSGPSTSLLMGRKVSVCLFHMSLLRTVSYKVPHHDMEVLGTSAPCCGRCCLGRASSGPADAAEFLERTGGMTPCGMGLSQQVQMRACVFV